MIEPLFVLLEMVQGPGKKPQVVTGVAMKRLFACFLFTLVFVGECSGQYYYGQIVHLKNAPFSATVQGSETNRESSNTWTVDIARAADGSVYSATPFGNLKSRIHLTIDDAVSHCSTEFWPYKSHLTRDNQGRLGGGEGGLSIGLAGGQPATSPVPTVEEIRNKNLKLQERWSTNSENMDPNARLRRFSLGQRSVDGMTIFGFRTEHTIDSETGRVIEEHWDSELGFTYSLSRNFPTESKVSVHSVTGLKLTEPPAELFRMQEKYFPPTDAFSNARTVFVSPFSGHADIQQRIESILTASGRLIVVADSKTADMVVLMGPVPEPLDHPATTPSRQVLLKFETQQHGAEFVPMGGNLMWVTLRFSGVTDDWAEEPVLNTCFANLWNNVESLHLSTSAISEK